MNSLIDSSVQCWGCPIFDRLFQIVSSAAASIYNHFAIFCVTLFAVLFAFFVLNAVWKNIRGGGKDPWYQKSVKPVIINSLFALVLLGMGVMLPRFLNTITFEPAAQITLVYTENMLQTDDTKINEKVTYQPMKMADNGFYTPTLRNVIIMLMKATITQFQAYMKLGIAVMDKAFSWEALLGVGTLIKHIILFFIGLYLVYGFFKLFVRFCFKFADIIIAMAYFAFFFPFSLMLVSFKGAENVPKWISELGKNVGANQFKNLINSIVSLVATVLTYIILIIIIAKFFTASGESINDLMTAIISGNVFAADFSEDNLASIGIISTVILIYILNFIYDQIPQVTNMVLSSFDVKEENPLSEQLANDTMRLTSDIFEASKTVGRRIIKGGKKSESETAAGDTGSGETTENKTPKG